MRPCRGRCPSDGLCGSLSVGWPEAFFSPDGKEIVFRLETGTGYAPVHRPRGSARSAPMPCIPARVSSTVEPRVEVTGTMVRRVAGLSAVPSNTGVRQQRWWCCVLSAGRAAALPARTPLGASRRSALLVPAPSLPLGPRQSRAHGGRDGTGSTITESSPRRTTASRADATWQQSLTHRTLRTVVPANATAPDEVVVPAPPNGRKRCRRGAR